MVTRELDLPGTALFAAALVALPLLLMNPHPGTWYPPVIVVAAGGAFAARELRADVPFTGPRGSGATGRCRRRTPAPWWPSPRPPAAARGCAASCFVGAVGRLAARALVLTLGAGSPVWILLVVTPICGVPQGPNSLALQNPVSHQADPGRMGSSAGLMGTFMYLGSMIASAPTATGAASGAHTSTGGLHRPAWFMLGAGALFPLLPLFDRGLRHVGAPVHSR
jgi:hypothetical protein